MEGSLGTGERAKKKAPLGCGDKQRREQSAERFRRITARAKEIRIHHPRMEWKNCIRQASKELR